VPVPRQAQSWNGLARRKPIARKAWGEKERVRYQSELKWQAQIIELAQVLGWWPFHLYYAQRSPAGWPDLVLFRERVIFAELKGRSKDGKAENLKRFAIANTVLPVLFALVDKAFHWDDESMLSALITGSLNGIPFWGNLIEPTVKGAVTASRGGRFFSFNGIGGNPVFENIDYAKRVIERIFRQGGQDDVSEDDILKTIDMLTDAVSKVAGIPYAGPARYAKNIYKMAETGEIDYRKLMGYSDYAINPTIAEKKQEPPRGRLSPRRRRTGRTGH